MADKPLIRVSDEIKKFLEEEKERTEEEIGHEPSFDDVLRMRLDDFEDSDSWRREILGEDRNKKKDRKPFFGI